MRGAWYKGTYYTQEQLDAAKKARAAAGNPDRPSERLQNIAGEMSFLVERGKGASAEYDRLEREYQQLRRDLYGGRA